MLDVFIDMTKASLSLFAKDDGGRCGVGNALWEIGIPHDRLLNHSMIWGLSCADQCLCDEVLPLLRHYEGDISSWYDLMWSYIGGTPLFKGGAEAASELIRYGRLAGINYIIASPLPKAAKREVACV